MRQLKPDWRIVLIYFFLLAIGIPWYWPDDSTLQLFGMPAWVTIALFISILVSVLTAYILLTFQWPGEEESFTENKDE